MCIIIDTNTLSKVFKNDNKEHLEFKPVLDWIINGNGKIVVGGTKFDIEIFEKVQWFIKLFNQLKSANKVVVIKNKLVDERQASVEKLKKHRKFDDTHVVALIGVSGCKLLCTHDSNSFPFVQDKTLYPKGKKPPAIYHKSTNKNLLCNTNISNCCTPNIRLTKKTAALIKATI